MSPITSDAVAKATISPRVLHVIKNSAWIFSSQLWFPLLSLAATPYIVHTMGVERYGVFAILSVFGGYLSYLELGFGWAIIKFVAEHDAADDEETLRRTVATSLLTTAAAGCAGCLLLIGLSTHVATRVIRLPANLIDEATFSLAITGLSFGMNSVIGTLNGVLKGLQRFDLTSTIHVSIGTATVVGTVLVLRAGYGLPGAVVLGTAITAISLIAHFWIVYRIRPSLCVLPRFHREEFRRMLGFSAFTTINRIGMTAVMQIDKFFVAYFLPVAAVSYYALAFTVAQKLNLIASNAATVLFPVASREFAVDGGRAYTGLYGRAAEIVFLLTSVPCVVLIVFAKPFLQLWLGDDFAQNASTALALLALGFAVVSVASIEAISIEGAGRPRVTARFFVISGMINVGLCPLLTRAYGVSGTAAAVAVSLLVLAILNIRFFTREMIGVSLHATLRGIYVRPAAIAAVAGAVAVLVTRLPSPNLLVVLGEMATIAAVSCAVGVWLVLNAHERQTMKTFMSSRLAAW